MWPNFDFRESADVGQSANFSTFHVHCADVQLPSNRFVPEGEQLLASEGSWGASISLAFPSAHHSIPWKKSQSIESWHCTKVAPSGLPKQ